MLNTIKDYGHNARGSFKTSFRNVCQQATECDRRKQQRFEAFTNCKVKKNNTNQHHDGIAHGKCSETTVIPYGL